MLLRTLGREPYSRCPNILVNLLLASGYILILPSSEFIAAYNGHKESRAFHRL